MAGRLTLYVALMALAALLAACDGGAPATPEPGENGGPSPTGRGSPTAAGKMALWDMSSGPHLRGANIWQARVYPELDGPDFKGPGPVGPPFIQADFDRLAELGANYVNISHPGLFSETPPYTLDQEIQKNLDDLLDMITEADMFAVISFRTGPGRSEFSFFVEDPEDSVYESYLNDSVWEDQAAQDAWVEMWRHTAERYRDHPIVAGYDLMVEPNAGGVFFEIYEPQEFYPAYANTLYDWNQLHPRISAAVREVDPDTPILVGGMGHSAIEWLPFLQPTDDTRTVYMAHQYSPVDYTHQGPPLEITYPGEFDIDYDDVDDQFSKAWLDDLLSAVDDFVATYGVPVAVNEFGPVRWEPGAAEFMDDQMDLFEQRGMNHALWDWSPSWEPFTDEVNEFNFRFGPDPENRADVDSTDLIDVITDYWGRNTMRPSANDGAGAPQAGSAPKRLADVDRWLYLIDVNLEPETVDLIAKSDYDMVVLDFIPSEVNNTDYPMAEVVARLQQAPHPKLVIAYIDIGEAEDYRTYWRDGWGIGNPEWIAGADPDGWEGNFPVAFWHDGWRDIWLGEDGYLQAIREDGFQGVYLDWVEAYSDENVVNLAEDDSVDPEEEIVSWVNDIAEFTRGQRSDFIVIGQNAAELAGRDDYLEIVDAIAQEQVWFDGGADNDPPGDCPLPETDAEVDTDDYIDSLSGPCRRYFESDPNSPLHVSSQEYLGYLTLAQTKGEIILTVDYALDPENVAWVYEMSRGMGFVPFVGNRGLDRYVEPLASGP